MADRLSVLRDVYDLYADAWDTLVMGDTFGYWETDHQRSLQLAAINAYSQAYELLGGDPHDLDHIPDMVRRRYADV